MKKSIIKISGIAMLFLSTSCSKESCSYVTECVESEPEGFMVSTKAASSNTNVATIYKTTYNSNAPIGNNWNDSSLGAGQVQSIVPSRWNVNDIGQVFGIAIDNSNGIYLSATDVYSFATIYGTAGSAGIYYTDVTTTTTTDLVLTGPLVIGSNFIPNSGIGAGNSIGNIAYDKVNNQLFATNLEDGRIYRIDLSTGNEGNILSVFDPFTTDVSSNGMVAVGEQLWGIGVLTESGNTSVYFARTNTSKEIWSIDLDASGEFIATEIGSTKIFTDSGSSSKPQILNIKGSQNKLTDIAFSCSGRMLVAERGDPHSSQIFEFVKSGTSWIAGNNFYVGNIAAGKNSAGGVDYGSRESSGSFTTDDIVWATGNVLDADPIWLYGIQGMSSLGNSPLLTPNSSTDLFIDRDATVNEKGGLGDVEIFDSSCPCNKR